MRRRDHAALKTSDPSSLERERIWNPRSPGPTPIIAVSPEMKGAVVSAHRAADSDAKVLITGESGVGKDLVAREIHQHSRRASQPFVAVNCAGLTETLLESELFGHVKGSFTGAYRDKPGKLQLAHRGTLFLDEVGEMSLRMQALLLRFLENGEIQSVGARPTSRARVDVRVVAATNRNLAELRRRRPVPRGPALPAARHPHPRAAAARAARRRPAADRAFLRRAVARPVAFSDEAHRRCSQRYRWPGNVRELQNVVEQAIWLSGATDDRRRAPAAVVAGARAERCCRRASAAGRSPTTCTTRSSRGGYSFWEHIHPLFLSRDITRHDCASWCAAGCGRRAATTAD